MLCGLPGNPTSSLHHGLASSLCFLALDSSSSFPCSAFLAIAKSFIYMVYYIDRLSYVEPSLHLWDKAYLVIVDNVFDDCSLKIREPEVPAPWFLDPGGWSKTAAVSLYFIFPGICTLSLFPSGRSVYWLESSF
ncbi:hypothetical protein STEG23_008281 [Scotinomys teguina]